MRLTRIITVTLALALPLLARGQSLDTGDRWIMNDRLLDLIDSYERFARLENRSDVYSFKSLFQSMDSEVWCDYVSSPDFGQQISAEKYLEYSSGLEDRSIRISNLKRHPFERKDGRWHALIEFDKWIEYEDSLGVSFSTVFPSVGGDFHIVMDCVWDKNDEEFRIAGISGSEGASFSFPKGRFNIVQLRNADFDTRVLNNGRPLEFNDYGYAILTEGANLEMDDDDYMLTVTPTTGADRYDFLNFAMVPKRIRARGHLSFSPSAYSVSSLSEDVMQSGSSGFTLGGDIGYSFLSLSKSTKLVAYFGLGLNFSNISLEANNISYYYSFSDNTGDPYIRTYSLDRITEGISMVDLVLQPFLSLEQNMGKSLSLVFDAGAKVYLNASAKLKPYHITGRVSHYNTAGAGITSELDDDFNQFIYPNQNSVNQFAASAFAAAGIDFAFMPGTYAYVRAGYETGLTSSFANPGSTEWYDKASGIYPLVYGGGHDVASHSFINSISYKRSGLTVEVGVKLKLGKL